MKQGISLLIFVLWNLPIIAQTILEYNLKVGDLFVIEQTAHQTIIQELDGTAHEITNDMNGVLEFKVTSEQAEIYEIDLMFKDLNLSMNSSIQGELMNVKAKEVTEGDIQSLIFNSLLNTPVKLFLSKNGNILEVQGGESLITKMVNTSGLEDDFSRNMMKASLEKEFGSEALANSYKQLTYIYTDSAVNQGDTWQNDYVGKLNAKNIWTLKEITVANAMISGTAEVVMKTNESGTEMNLIGTQNTIIKTDIQTGVILEMIVEGQSIGASKMAQLGDREIPTTINSTITYKLIKD